MSGADLGEKLFTAVRVLRGGWISIFFFQAGTIRVCLPVFGINARGGRKQIAVCAILARGFDGIKVDRVVVAHNLSMIVGDETHAAHVCSQCVNLTYSSSGTQAIIPQTQIQEVKFMRLGATKFGKFQVHAANPISLTAQERNQVATNETTSASNQNASASQDAPIVKS